MAVSETTHVVLVATPCYPSACSLTGSLDQWRMSLPTSVRLLSEDMCNCLCAFGAMLRNSHFYWFSQKWFANRQKCARFGEPATGTILVLMIV